MSRIFRAAAWSGIASVCLFFVIGFSRNTDSLELSLDLLWGLLIAVVFMWVSGAFAAFVLLLLLTPVADRVRPWLSMALFLVVGFFPPAWIEFEMIQTGEHGNPPAIQTEPLTKLAFDIALFGLMGSGCALAAWISLRMRPPVMEESEESNQSVQTRPKSRPV